MKRAIKDHWKDFAAILGLLLISGAVSAVILTEQRLRFPFIEHKPLKIYADMDSAQAVQPGQGQAVIAGVKVGLIGQVKLLNGQARVELDIDPKFKDIVHTKNVSGLLRPRTGLKDEQMELDPGDPKSPVAKDGFVIPASDTMPDVNLDQILSSLDADTREHLQLLLGGAAGGLKGRGLDLAELFKRYGPTVRDLREVNQAVAQEREGLKDSIHGLSQLSTALAAKDNDIARLVDASAAVFEAFASEDKNVSLTVHKLPGALRATTTALQYVRGFANQLGPATNALRPTFQALNRTNHVVTPIAKKVTPIIANQVRPFVREAQPLVSNLRPAAQSLQVSLPDLTDSFKRINTLFNLLGYNQNGREGPDVSGREEGYLFWLAWLTHQTENLINVDDANGPMRPIFLTGTCQTLTSLVNDQPQLEFLLGLTGVLANACNNPTTLSLNLPKVKRQLARSDRKIDLSAKTVTDSLKAVTNP